MEHAFQPIKCKLHCDNVIKSDKRFWDLRELKVLLRCSLIGAEFAAAAVLITYGAVLGKVSRLELLIIGFLEVIFFAINEWIAIEFLKYSDAGGSLIIHAFGAYFGLAVARVLWTRKAVDNSKEGSVYHSDLFAMIGEIMSDVTRRTYRLLRCQALDAC